MDKSEALALLTSGNARERLLAARILQRVATQADVLDIRAALDREPVVWTRTALGSALRRATGQPVRAPKGRRRAIERDISESASAQLDEVRDQVTHDFSLLVVHLLDPIVGSLRVHASNEVELYERSDTASAIERLRSLLQSLHRLGRASAAAALKEVELAELMRGLRQSEFADHLQSIELEGPDNLVCITDPVLVQLIVGMAIRNGLEAELSSGAGRVRCTWGRNSDHVWVRVQDNGRSLAGGPSHPFELGVSGKPGHAGMGLTVAAQAARSLGGTIDIANSREVGCTFELAIPDAGGKDAHPAG